MRDRPLPKLREGFVLVKTVAVAANPIDWMTIDGFPAPGSLQGHDYAGVVEEVAIRLQVVEAQAGLEGEGEEAFCHLAGVVASGAPKTEEGEEIPSPWAFRGQQTRNPLLRLPWSRVPGYPRSSGGASTTNPWACLAFHAAHDHAYIPEKWHCQREESDQTK